MSALRVMVQGINGTQGSGEPSVGSVRTIIYVGCSFFIFYYFRWELQVKTHEDLNRQIVKSDYSGVSIPEVDFEIPPQSQKGGQVNSL